MRKFLLGLVAYGCALSLLGGGLGVSEASAKTVLVYCAPKSKAVKYPHWNGTRVRCYAPRFWVRVRYKWAIRIGTYPILLANRPNTSACVGGKPKVARSPGASSWRLVRQRCTKQVIRYAAYKPDTIITEHYAGEGAQYVIWFTAGNINSPNYAIEFQCRVDGKAWYACGDTGALPTYEYLSGLDAGRHVFRVRTLFRGAVDPTPAKVVFYL